MRKFRVMIKHSNNVKEQSLDMLIQEGKNFEDRIDFMISQIDKTEGKTTKYRQHATTVLPDKEERIVLCSYIWIETKVPMNRLELWTKGFFNEIEFFPWED
jgi:hypothetical protein